MYPHGNIICSLRRPLSLMAALTSKLPFALAVVNLGCLHTDGFSGILCVNIETDSHGL
jgi:hypothetical protein